MLDAVESGPTARTHYTLFSVRDSKWDGVPVVEVKFSGQQGYIDTLYLDPANDLAFLGSESDGSHDFKTSGKSPIKLLSRVTYRPSSEGYPHPWKFETWNLMPDGTRVPQTYTEVIEYAKYAPTADDFDLEKQFGVKPPGSVTAVGAGRSWWWLYAIAVLVALLAVTLVVVACRRGAATLSR